MAKRLVLTSFMIGAVFFALSGCATSGGAKKAKIAQEVKAAEQTKGAQETKAAKQPQEVKAAKPAKEAQKAKVAEPAKEAQEAKAAKSAKEAQKAKVAEPAKEAQEAKAAPKAKAAEEVKSKRFVLRVNCGAYESYTDKAGNVWLPDQFMEEGKDWGAVDGMTIDRGELGIADTNSPKIYETERYSLSAYKFKLSNGKFTVRLHFAETFDGITGEGQRVFSVSINDNAVLKDLDVYKETGGLKKPLVKEFKGVAITNKELVIGFTSNIENPEINGIEILSE